MFVGRRGSGKTFLMQDILWHKRWMPKGVVFSATEDCNEFWSQHFPKSFIYPEYKPEVMANIIASQRVKAIKAKRDPNYKLEPIIVLGEDIFYNKNEFTKDKSAKYAFLNGRHVLMFLLISVQYMIDLDRNLRNSVDYLFVLQDNVIGNRERLYKNWFGVVPTFEAFNAIMSHFTEDRGCIVLDNTSLSNKIEDCIYWYKAQDRGKYKVGSKGYWLYHHVNKKSEEDIERELEEALLSKQKQTYRFRKGV
jgi:hypothetical protein